MRATDGLRALALLIGLLLSILPATPAAAQDTAVFQLGGGFVLPVAETSDITRPGFNIDASGIFPLSGRVGVQVSASYTRLHLEWDPALVELGYEPERFRGAGGFLEGGYHWAGVGTAGMQLLLRSPDRVVVPHLHAAAGIARTGTADTRAWFLGDIETFPGALQTALAADVGAGVDLRVRSGTSAFVRARYLVLFTDPTSKRMIPIQIGLSLRLEPR